jgi:hypothetical protein
MRSFSFILIFSGLFLGPCCAIASADGGRVVLVERLGDYQISVFTSPEPLRAGLVDISVLLQDSSTGQPIMDAQVNVSLTPSGGRARPIRAVATMDAATNKLLYAALLDLPDPGSWEVEIACFAEHFPAAVRFTIEAGPRSTRWLKVWPWFSWPVGVVLLFGVHRLLVCRRETASSKSLRLLS